MLIDTTSQVIRAHIEGAPTTTNPVFTTTYADITSTTFVAAESSGALNSVTEVSVIASPAASTARHVKELQIYNGDSVQHTITVDFFDGTNTLIYGNFVVPAGLFVRYSPDTGWQIGVGVGVGVGTVTSVALTAPVEFTVGGSPITGAGTLALLWANENANLVFAGPSSGPAGMPAFRGLAAADIPALSYVTSVAMTVPSRQTVTGSPIMSSGTFAITDNNQNANLVFAGPLSGGAAAPTFRSLVAGDIPSLSSLYLPLAGGTMAGAILNPNGSASAPQLAFNTNYGWFYDTTDTGLGIAINGSQTGWFDITGLIFSIAGGGTSNIQVRGEGTVNNIMRRVDNSANSPNVTLQKGRGTLAFPVVCAVNDITGSVNFAQYNGSTGFGTGARVQAVNLETTPSTTALGSSLRFGACAIGSASITEITRQEVATGLSMFGANVVIDANRIFRRRVFTVATLPAGVVGMSSFVSDALGPTFGAAVVGGGAVQIPVYYDGAWKVG